LRNCNITAELFNIRRRQDELLKDNVSQLIAEQVKQWDRLSFPKIQSGGIRAVRQNQRIIRCDVCDHPPARSVYSRSVQVTAPA
jgi:hypothetical protein